MKVTATFLGARRAKNTPNGNPQWTIHTSVGDFHTATDSMIAQYIDNYISPDHGIAGRTVVLYTEGPWVTDIRDENGKHIAT